MEDTNVKLNLFIGLGTFQALIGLGALGGGFMLVIDPSGSTLGLPIDLVSLELLGLQREILLMQELQFIKH